MSNKSFFRNEPIWLQIIMWIATLGSFYIIYLFIFELTEERRFNKIERIIYIFTQIIVLGYIFRNNRIKNIK